MTKTDPIIAALVSNSRDQLVERFALGYKQHGGTFVDYVRSLDPRVPEKNYQDHESYVRADAMRRRAKSLGIW